MPLNLLLRGESASPLTAQQHDTNLTSIETFVNGLETGLSGLSLATISGTVPVTKGGTGGTSASTAQANLNVPDRGPSGNEVLAFWRGTQSQYDALPTKLATTIYFITA